MTLLCETRELYIAVGEFKTSGYSSIDDALYGNSGQAIGYAVVLDTIVGGLADYDVMYFVYSAGTRMELPSLPRLLPANWSGYKTDCWMLVTATILQSYGISQRMDQLFAIQQTFASSTGL